MQEPYPNKRPKRKRIGDKPLIVYKWKDEEELAQKKALENQASLRNLRNESDNYQIINYEETVYNGKESKK